MADAAPSSAIESARRGSPPGRQKWLAALCTLALVVLLHWWTLGEIAALIGPLGDPEQSPSDITSPILTRTITLPVETSAVGSPAPPAASAPRPLESPAPATEMQAATSPAPALEAVPVSAPVPVAQEPPSEPPQPLEPPAPVAMPLAAASASAAPPAPEEKVAVAPVPIPLPVPAPKPEAEPTPGVPPAPPVPALLPLPVPDAKAPEQPAPAPKVQPEPAPAIPVAPPTPAPAPTSAAASVPASAPTSRPLLWPGSKVLAYQLEINSFPLPARAELRWRHDGTQYEASLALQSLISVTRSSKGAITPQGLEPLRYGEKITARGETAVHFQRDKGLVSFSNNKPSLALLPGVQDELSVFFQIAAMLGGDPREAAPGTEIAVQTVESRAARKLVFVVGASQMLDLPGGRTQTVYLSHAEPPNYEGSRGSKGELWLAPGLDYLPVRIRITEPSGTMYDLRWSQTLPP